MATQAIKDVLKNGLPSALDRFLGPSTGFEENRTFEALPIPGSGQGTASDNAQPVDNVPGERIISGVPNAVTIGGAVLTLVAGVGLIAVAVR